MVIAIDNFFGCYLLYCINPKYKGRTYIGFTVNPERRITQHNAGKHKGGAWRTSGRGPWDMALIVHGFPSDIAALRFEWAWQNPDRSRNLKHVSGKKRSESPFAFRVRVMANMLCVPPWTRLPLVVRWLKQEYALDLEPVPPSHIPIAYGPVTAKVKKHASNKKETKSKSLDEPSSSQPHTSYDKQESKQDSDDECLPLAARIARKVNPSAPTCSTTIKDPIMNCVICQAYVSEEDKLCCLNEDCGAISHMKCLAKHFLLFGEDLQILPVEGICPKCNVTLLWGDLIRTTNGFHQYIRSDT